MKPFIIIIFIGFVSFQLAKFSLIRNDFIFLNESHPDKNYKVKEIKVFDKVKKCTKDIFIEYFNKYLNGKFYFICFN